MVKNLPASQKAWIRSLGQEYLLEKGMATHSSILAWRIPWTEEPGRLWSVGLQRVGHEWEFFTFRDRDQHMYFLSFYSDEFFFLNFLSKKQEKFWFFFFFWLKKYLFIYFSLCWVFIALCRLSVVVSGDHCCGARDSYCGGFLSCRAWL